MNIKFIIFFFVLILTNSQAQIKKLQEYIEKGHSFDQICKKADKLIRKNKLEDETYREKEFRHKVNTKDFLDDEKLKFERWKWYWRDRLTEDGKFPDLQRQWALYNSITHDSKSINRSAVEWKHEGPVENSGGYWGMGRAVHIAFHPSLTNVFYVASPNGGLWKTTDNGLTYESIADNLPYQPVGIVIVDPRAPNTLYITLGEKEGWWQYSMGVYKTIDGGKNWKPTGLNWKLTDNRVIYALEMNPQNTSILLAATSDGMYKTWNGGNSWEKIRAENFSDVKFMPGDTNIVYAATNDYWGASEVLKSIDGGNAFNKVTNFGFQKVFIKFATTLDDPTYVGLNMSVDGAKKFYLSKNAGESFEYVSDMPENFVMYFSQKNKNTMYCGYVVIYRSDDEGKNWFQITNWWNSGDYPEVHADHHFIAHHPVYKDELYFCCDGGVYRYHENTDQWDELVNGLAVTQFYKLAISTTNPPVIIGGSQDNGGWIKRSDGSWGNTNGGDAMSQVIDPTNQNIGYTEYWGGNAVYRTTSGFAHLDDITLNIGAELPGQWVTPFSLNPKNPKTFIIGFNDVFVSHDRCNTFHKISDNLTGNKDNDLREVKISPVDTNLIIATRANIMYSTKDFGKTWKQYTLVTGLEITGLEFHPKDTNRLWCTRGGYGTIKVMTSKNKGTSWTNLTGNFVNTPVTCITYDEASNLLFVGSDFGVFFTNADSINWQYYGNGLPHTTVTDIKIHKTLRKLFVSTYGRGFYSIDLPECTSVENNISFKIDKQDYKTGDSIFVCAGSSILLKARDSLPGTYHWMSPGMDTVFKSNRNWYIYYEIGREQASGNYFLEFTDENGCKTSDTLFVKIWDKPDYYVDSDHPYLDCHHDSLLLRPNVIDTINYSYRWLGPNLDVNNYSAVVKVVGEYYLQLKILETDCSFYELFELNRLYDPLLDTKEITHNKCFGDSLGSIQVHAIAGKSPYEFLWSNQLSGNEIQNLKAGIYYLTIQDENLCEGHDTLTVTEPEDFNVNLTIQPSSGNDGSIILNLTGATPPYKFSWTQHGGTVFVSDKRVLTDLTPGFYDLKITDANNCMFFKNGIEVKEIVSNSDLKTSGIFLYPNPAKDFLNLKFIEDVDPSIQLELLDVKAGILKMKGRIIDQKTIQIRVDHLVPGEYFIKVNRKNRSERFMFNKL